MRAAIVLCLALAASCSSTPATNGSDAGASADVASDVAVGDDVATDAATAPEDVNEPAPTAPLTWPVDQPGRFRVGYTRWNFTYTPRGQSTPRTIPIHAWYPTLARDGAHPTYALIFRDRVSIVDAPPAAPVHEGGYPVHVYTHGHQGFGPTSAFLMRHFASHGWIAVAPDHVGNGLTDTPNPLPPAIRYLRALDVSASLDALDMLPMEHPLRGRASTRRAVLSGHSAGCHTVWAILGATYDMEQVAMRCAAPVSCSPEDLAVFRMGVADPRFIAGIPMAGSIQREWFGPMGHAPVRAPMFSMSGTADPVGADAQFMTATGVDLTWINIADGCHQFFALGSCTNIPDSEQTPIVGTYALAFARKHLLNDPDATVASILSGTQTVSSRVAFQRRTP